MLNFTHGGSNNPVPLYTKCPVANNSGGDGTIYLLIYTIYARYPKCINQTWSTCEWVSVTVGPIITLITYTITCATDCTHSNLTPVPKALGSEPHTQSPYAWHALCMCTIMLYIIIYLPKTRAIVLYSHLARATFHWWKFELHYIIDFCPRSPRPSRVSV